MNTPTEQEQVIPALPRTDTVVMGRQGFFSILRLIGVELYKLRRRMMSKVLSTITILSIIIPFCLIAFTPDPLSLSEAVTLVAQILNIVGMIVIVIVAGTIVGGEYSVGTVRLMLTRGPSRTQFLCAKLGAVLACVVIGVTGLTSLGILLTAGIDLMKDSHIDFLTGTSISSIIFYLLATIIGLFLYGSLACCLSILGKATAAGVAGTILWWVLEGLLSTILPFIGGLNKGLFYDFLKAIPDYFMGRNIEALAQNALVSTTAGIAISTPQALVVLTVYLLLFTGLAWWVNERRDIIN